jgi:hypothetical protein
MIFTLVHNHLKKSEGALRCWKRLEVTVRQGKKTYCSGYAYYHYGPITLTLARRETELSNGTVLPNLTTRQLAWLFYHEVMHVYGYKHNQHVDISSDELDMLCAELPKHPPKAEVKEKPKVDSVVKRAASVDARIEKWEMKLKRAATALKKLRRQQRYYAKKLAEPRPEPKPRKKPAKRLNIFEFGEKHGVNVEKEDWDEGYFKYIVTPKEGCDTNADPYYGDHYVDSAKEARERVLVYAGS